jgi:Family of unknown function (DUF6328)
MGEGEQREEKPRGQTRREGEEPDEDDIRRAAQAHGQTEEQVLDRNFVEILQELRVAQTGVQILFAFLLSIAFSNRFPRTTPGQRDIYVVTLILCTMATGLLIAPVAYHRLLFRRRQRRELVEAANRLAIGGLFLLLAAMVGAVVLILDFVVGGLGSVLLGGLVAIWLAGFWVGLPLTHRARLRAKARSGPDR